MYILEELEDTKRGKTDPYIEKGEIGNCIGLISTIVSSSPISILFLKSRDYLSLMSICVYPRVSSDVSVVHLYLPFGI
jgi:hypothetical protein